MLCILHEPIKVYLSMQYLSVTATSLNHQHPNACDSKKSWEVIKCDHDLLRSDGMTVHTEKAGAGVVLVDLTRLVAYSQNAPGDAPLHMYTLITICVITVISYFHFIRECCEIEDFPCFRIKPKKQ